MKKTIQKILSITLILTMVLTMIVPASAAGFFTTQEIFGYEGRIFLTVREDVPVRAEPHNEGKVLAYLPKGYPVEAVGLFRTWKGSEWVKISNEGYEGTEAWIFVGNLEIHSHTFVQLTDLGFEFCSQCGHLHAIRPDSTVVDVDALHVVLAAASLLPVIGNGFDLLDGMVSLSEGDYGGAALSFASAVPMFGSIGNALKASDNAVDVFDGANDTMRAVNAADTTVTAVRLGENAVVFTSKTDSQKLARNMRKAFKESGKDRFYDCADYWLETGSMAAHHIVAGGDTNEFAVRSRALLAYVGLDVNDAENGVFLVQNAKHVADGAKHSGRHSKEYYKIIHDRLFAAYNNAQIPANANADEILTIHKNAIIEELDKIADTLMYTNDIPLY